MSETQQPTNNVDAMDIGDDKMVDGKPVENGKPVTPNSNPLENGKPIDPETRKPMSPGQYLSSDPSSTITVIHRTERTLMTKILMKFLRFFRGKIIFKIRPQPKGSRKLSPHKVCQKLCSVEHRFIGPIRVYDLLPFPIKDKMQKHEVRHNERKKVRRIYYIAGGSWQMPPGKQHWQTCGKIAKELPETIVSMVSAPLAPKSPAPQGFPMMLQFYQHAMKDAAEAGDEVVWAGDSSGANLILAVSIEAMRLDKEHEYVVPKALVAISPSTDLSRENPDINEVDKFDPIMTIADIQQSAKAWAGDWDRKDPRLSPNFADLDILRERGVKVHGVTGSRDVLAADAVIFREKLAKAGVTGEWLHWDKQMHDFPLAWMYGLFEAREGLQFILKVMKE